MGYCNCLNQNKDGRKEQASNFFRINSKAGRKRNIGRKKMAVKFEDVAKKDDGNGIFLQYIFWPA